MYILYSLSTLILCITTPYIIICEYSTHGAKNIYFSVYSILLFGNSIVFVNIQIICELDILNE